MIKNIDPLFIAVTVIVGVPIALLFESRIWGGMFGIITGWVAAFIVTEWREK